jgi:hypothetical protein
MTCLLSAVHASAFEGPVAQIVAPSDGFKLHAGRIVAVRVRVEPAQVPIRNWTLRLTDAGGATHEIARGTEPVPNEVIAEIAADALEAGSTYTLILRAADTAGTSAEAQSSIRIPDPQYTLIPLEARNLARGSEHSLALDASGNLSIIGGRARFGGELIVRDSSVGTVRRVYIQLSSSSGLVLSRDAQRLFYFGSYRHPNGTGSIGLG